MTEQHDTIVIGGGQAGLAMSYHLRAQDREHVVLERDRVAARWHGERWDSLYFQFPNWSLQLPGYAYAGSEPDAFAHRSEVARFIEDYARFIDAPLRCGIDVQSLELDREARRFRLITNGGTFEAQRVVVATGPFQRERIPALHADFDAAIFQTSARRYRAPAQLPPGAVLIVGAGGSGCQIAEELLEAGRKVYLCVGRHRRIPRRYRGRDLLAWLEDLGTMSTPIDAFPNRQPPPPILLTGFQGGHDMDLRELARAGAVLTGKLVAVEDGIARFDDSLEPSLAAADESSAAFVRAVDEHVRVSGIAVEEERPGLRAPTPLQSPRSIDMKMCDVTSIIWCTGYSLDFGWIKIDVFAGDGTPQQQRGVTNCPGLYFLGLHWMHTFRSGTLFGVGGDAAYLATHIEGLHSGKSKE